VLLIHDASIDEYIAFLLLTTMPEVKLLASVLVNADCVGSSAMQVGWRIQEFIGRPDIALKLSRARGVNPFPWSYREDCLRLGRVAALQQIGPNPNWPPYPDGDIWLKKFFLGRRGKITILCLGPLTPLATLLSEMPSAALKIERLFWMGGAINVCGNLDPDSIPPELANPYAEWNVFWDPFAAESVFSNPKFPITLFPLDLTNQAKIDGTFKNQLAVYGKASRLADLALQGYRLVSGQPYYTMWDVAAAAYLARPKLYADPRRMKLKVVTEGDRQGAIIQDSRGREVDVVLKFADPKGLDHFYAYVLQQLRGVNPERRHSMRA